MMIATDFTTSTDLKLSEAATVVNLQTLMPGAITTIEHPAMPDLARLRKRNDLETWCVVEQGKLGALCSVWRETLPPIDGQKTAALGHFFAHTPAAGQILLDDVCKKLTAQGIEYVIGPMDGDTWHRYRLVTEQGTTPPFFLEYMTPAEWPAMFTKCGFAEIARYCSAQTTDLNYTDRSAQKFAKRAETMGLTVRPIDLTKIETELRALYRLSMRSFAHNHFYTPITAQDFLALYRPLLPYLVPEHVLLAEHNGELVGVLFAVPDYLQQTRGETMDTLIIKTLARAPERRYAGLGSYLSQLAHQQAAAAGYKRVIHALMHEQNASLVISQKSAEIIRRYALYGKRLGSV